MKPIVYKGKEYKDELFITTELKVSLRMRLSFLFCTHAIHRQSIFCEEVMPKHLCANGSMEIYSLIDWLKAKLYSRRGFLGTPLTPIMYIEHKVVDMDSSNVQRCVVCGEIICDYRNSAGPASYNILRGGFPAGFVYVKQGNPSIKSSVIGSGIRYTSCHA